ncbi:unnamed protein product [Timema podura]|uniref:Uncharacterized protein n=1 Tax=Timema podura TaxID=61482 RepID=A0ABN7PCC0_TIMPD|nr:unnamed protein product [Timema podura]
MLEQRAEFLPRIEVTLLEQRSEFLPRIESSPQKQMDQSEVDFRIWLESQRTGNCRQFYYCPRQKPILELWLTPDLTAAYFLQRIFHRCLNRTHYSERSAADLLRSVDWTAINAISSLTFYWMVTIGVANDLRMRQYSQM